MAPEPGVRRSVSPESSGRNTPTPRQWRNQLGSEETPTKDKHYRKYASGVERALSLFDTALQEWADYISFLSRLLKALQARPSSITTIPSKALVAKRLSQCLNPSLPSGVHQKALEVYNYVFSAVGKEGLSRDLPLYLPGLASTLSFASLTVRNPFLALLEKHFLQVDPKSLRPAMKSIILALLPGLEEETSEEFDRTLKLIESFKVAIRPPSSKELSKFHSTGDDFFWQCFFLATITSQSRRPGALAYLVKPDDMELLLRAAVGVVTRRDMSLNRRLWAWFLGPEPANRGHENGTGAPASPSDQNQNDLASKTSYFEEYGLHPLTRALLSMINSASESSPTERARPFRICLSLMDRWEIGGLVVPEIFLPVISSVRNFKSNASNKAEFSEVLRSASVFFDGVESGLIYGEIVGLMAQAVGAGNLSQSERAEKLSLVQFIMKHFNIREEEMVTIHAPLAALSILAMVGDVKERSAKLGAASKDENDSVSSQALEIALGLIELIPERAFPTKSGQKDAFGPASSSATVAGSNVELLKKIRDFYISDQGNVEASLPFASRLAGHLLLQRACYLTCDSLGSSESTTLLSNKSRILALLLAKAPQEYPIDTETLISSIQERLSTNSLPFISFKSVLSLSTQLYNGEPAIADLMLKNDTTGSFAIRPADPGRTFSVLWSHTLQDGSSHADRRPSKTPLELKFVIRLSGVEHYEVMLTRPLFLMLDSLLDERTQLFMAVKNWLNSMVGIDKLFLVFVTKITELGFLRSSPRSSNTSMSNQSREYSADDDLDLGLYYLRTLSNVFRWAPDAFWGVLATRMVEEPGQFIVDIACREGDLSLQELFVHVCMRCIAGNKFPNDSQLQLRVAQLHRSALTLLHQILLNPYAEGLSKLRLEEPLIERLIQSLEAPDPYVQVLLLDAVFASLRLRSVKRPELPSSPTGEKRALSYQSSSIRPSSSSAEHLATEASSPPPSLLKCIQAGLSSSSSRSVLDSWVGFLTECLPFYSNSIFQVLIPLVETLCGQIGNTFEDLRKTFKQASKTSETANAPETTLISLLNALEQVLAKAHDCLLAEEARTSIMKSPDQPQGFFGNIFNSDAPQSRSATANDRLTVLLAFQDAVRMSFKIWSWGQGSEASSLDPESASSFSYTSLRMRNRARRLLEHVFAAEALECLETVVDIWRASFDSPDVTKRAAVLNLLPALDGSRPRHTIPAIFNAIYSRTNPNALDPSRKSTLTVSLQDTDLVIFLVDYARSLEDDAMDEIWQDCMTFLKDLLGNPFPHRQTLPSLLEFAAILGEKVDNTNFGEQRKMRRELGDLFLRLLTALFTTRPASFTDVLSNSQADASRDGEAQLLSSTRSPSERAEDVVGTLSSIVPNLPKILVEQDRVLTAATAISANVIGPAIRSKNFPEIITKGTLVLLHELTRLAGNQKTWKKDISDSFNDARFFGSSVVLVQNDWLPLLRQWTLTDNRDRMTEILARIAPPTTAGIVFGVGATSARLEADRKTQLNLRRIATLILASGFDAFAGELPAILDRLVELLAATATSSPSSTTRSEIYMVVRALVLRTSAVHLSPLWPVVNAELHAALSSVAAPESSPGADTFSNAAVLQACKLLDLLIAVAPDDFQLHEWLFITDTVDAVYRSAAYQPVALVDELSEELGSDAVAAGGGIGSNADPTVPASLQQQGQQQTDSMSAFGKRRPLLADFDKQLTAAVAVENNNRKDELVARVLRPFFAQLSIFAFESTYAMGALDVETCVVGLLGDLFDERTVVKAL
ncbi:hypothetical protein DL764_000091 [Monosporascus ibericus]|uniref:Dopey N-terminal domain-containing protein n=1 Tax=Monosporascus ibericus TaxID=155417 RepID=A0A4Q4TYK3_9PEZI|nr:hypothetical protein DL764_000091 [Monosporascus ibericus]